MSFLAFLCLVVYLHCIFFFFFFKQKTAYEIMPSLVGSEMCIRDSQIYNQNSPVFPNNEVPQSTADQGFQQQQTIFQQPQVNDQIPLFSQDQQLLQQPEQSQQQFQQQYIPDQQQSQQQPQQQQQQQQQSQQCFGILVPGQLPITSFQIINNMYVSEINQPSQIPTLTFFIFQPIPQTMGAALYFSAPPYQDLQFIGAVANSRPSDIFSTGWSVNPEVNQQQQIKLVIKLETLESLKPLVELSEQNNSQKNYAKLVAKNLYNFMSVSYTHLTLPTICSVQISVVAVSLKKKKKTPPVLDI
eukprot:TRINITY_DN32321_c0_g1_i2.p1 TRINITY_DN32321_c0_g1~~TRINITY_DN32321_c0_g1_i2.p1  ORF type:complete len:300 (+),score=65.16 TRINITY_DN32321_c0_g1_i2:2-901(+)